MELHSITTDHTLTRGPGLLLQCKPHCVSNQPPLGKGRPRGRAVRPSPLCLHPIPALTTSTYSSAKVPWSFLLPGQPQPTKIQPMGCLQIKLAGTQPLLFLCTSSPGRGKIFLATKPMRLTAGPLQRKQLTLFSVLARVPLPARTLSPSLSARTTPTHPSTPAGLPQSPEHPLRGLSARGHQVCSPAPIHLGGETQTHYHHNPRPNSTSHQEKVLNTNL